MTSTLPLWLAGRTQSDLADILQRRPGVLLPYPPEDLDELAERLHYPHSLRDVLYDLPQPCLELLETLLVFGSGGMTRNALAAVFHRDEDDQELGALLTACGMWAIAWETDGKVWIPGALRSMMPTPLRLGPPVSELLGPRTVDDLRNRAIGLGLTPKNRKSDILAAIEARYADGAAIRALVNRAPTDQRELIKAAAWVDPVLRAEAVYLYPGRIDPAISWLVNHGLVMADWQRVVVPREVGVAIRGADWHPTLTPHPPIVPGVQVGVDVIDRDAAAAANTAIEQFTAIIEASGATPVALLKTGGVGVREIRRLAKLTKVSEPATRLWLELAYAGDLVDVDGSDADRDELVPTSLFDEWLAHEPARRLTTLIETWMELGAVPLLDARPAGIPAAAALMPDTYGSLASELRRDVLAVAAQLPEGTAVAAATVAPVTAAIATGQAVTGNAATGKAATGKAGTGASGTPASAVAALRDSIAWRRPIVAQILRDVSFATGPLWAEAALFGLIGRDAISTLGRAVLSGLERLEEVAPAFVQVATAQAIFQADLTVVVTGTPTAALAHLLDAVANRESRGAAGTWRCSPDSVRRALDTGHTSTGLIESLRAIAVGGALPQPLEYLIADVARRHGALRVRTVGCVLRADDPALLAEIASTKSLASLQLSIVAPTVLASALPADRTLTALRSAGYAPVGEAADGTPVIERRTNRRAAKRGTVLRFPPDFDDDFDELDDQDDLDDYESPMIRQIRRGLARGGATRGGAPDTSPASLAKTLLNRPLARPKKDPVGRHLSAVPPAPTRQFRPDPPVRTATMQIVQRSASRLPLNQQTILAQAIDHGRDIRIDYVSSEGERSSRIIQPTELEGSLVVAWCYLRNDERNFSLSRITGVRPA